VEPHLRLPALWVGLLYDQAALDAAWDLVKHWDMAGREALRNAVPKLGLDAPLPGGGSLRDIAGEVLDIAASGLTARGPAQRAGDNETGFSTARRDRRLGQGAGAASARQVPRRMGRRHPAGLRREFLMLVVIGSFRPAVTSVNAGRAKQ
jgi:gamma-glutamylcysteine synthetase